VYVCILEIFAYHLVFLYNDHIKLFNDISGAIAFTVWSSPNICKLIAVVDLMVTSVSVMGMFSHLFSLHLLRRWKT